MKTLVCFGDSITADEKDGLHFGPQGYEHLAKIIGEKLKGILEEAKRPRFAFFVSYNELTFIKIIFIIFLI